MENIRIYGRHTRIDNEGNIYTVQPDIEILFDRYGPTKMVDVILNLEYEYSKCMWRVRTGDIDGWEVYDFSEGSPILKRYNDHVPLPAWMEHKIAVLDMLPIPSDLVSGVGYRPAFGLYWLEEDDGDTRSES